MATQAQYTAAANTILADLDKRIDAMGGIAKSMADYHRAEMIAFINGLAKDAVDAALKAGG